MIGSEMICARSFAQVRRAIPWGNASAKENVPFELQGYIFLPTPTRCRLRVAFTVEWFRRIRVASGHTRSLGFA